MIRPSSTIIGIDPGTTESALVVWSPEKLSHIFEENGKIKNLISSFRDGHIYIEMIACQGMPVGKTTFETVLWIGRFYEASRIPVTLIPRNNIKLHHCGSSRAKDGNVRQVIIDKVGPKGTNKNPGPTHGISKHCWQALAVAVMGLEVFKGK